MKKFIISMLLLVAAGSFASLYAQQKGDKFVGTMLGFGIQKSSVKYENNGGSEKYENDPIVTLNLEPGFHYFIADKFRLGLQMSLTRMSQKNDEEGETVKSSEGVFAVGPVASYYVQMADKFYFSPELGFYFAHSKSKQEVGNQSQEQKANGFLLNLVPVKFEFRPTDRIGIAASLFNVGITHLKLKDTGDVDVSSNALSLNLGINPTVGIHIYL